MREGNKVQSQCNLYGELLEADSRQDMNIEPFLLSFVVLAFSLGLAYTSASVPYCRSYLDTWLSDR